MKKIGIVLVLGAVSIGSTSALAESVSSSSKSCGVDAYQSKITETQNANKGLEKNAQKMSNANGNQVIFMGGGGTVRAGGLAALTVFTDDAVEAGNGSDIKHYNEVIDIINESRLPASQLASYQEKNERLYNTVRLITDFYKNDPQYSMQEAAHAVQNLVRSGKFCHADGSLAVTGEFRDLIVKEMRADTSVAARMANRGAEAAQLRNQIEAGSKVSSSPVDRVKSGESNVDSPASPTGLTALVDGKKAGSGN